ncbi:hypothetical protein Taro_052687 [Colocasia esculenta]|uniref:Uncharacterized protein n=1 Tax=Colocasia esculenta TaxID=4460 RepID=A0A843XJC1_COLES|nr:hypothetical protein [Colocasia esculenta]
MFLSVIRCSSWCGSSSLSVPSSCGRCWSGLVQTHASGGSRSVFSRLRGSVCGCQFVVASVCMASRPCGLSGVLGGSACGPSTLWRSEVAEFAVRRHSHLVVPWSQKVYRGLLLLGVRLRWFLRESCVWPDLGWWSWRCTNLFRWLVVPCCRGSSLRELGVGRVAEAVVAPCVVSSSESECCELLYPSELRVVFCKSSGSSDLWVATRTSGPGGGLEGRVATVGAVLLVVIGAFQCVCAAKAERACVWCGLHRCRVVACGTGGRCPCLVGCPSVVGVCVVVVVCLALCACALCLGRQAEQAEVHRLVALCSGGGFPELFVVVLSGALVVLVEVLLGPACVASAVLLAAVFSLMVRVVLSFGLCILVKVLPRIALCRFWWRFFPGVLRVCFEPLLCCSYGSKCAVWLGCVLVRFSQNRSWRFWWRFSPELLRVISVVVALSLSVEMSCLCLGVVGQGVVPLAIRLAAALASLSC